MKNRQFNPDMLLIARQARGLTQEELVAKAKGSFSQPTLSRIESGLQRPSDDEIEHIARVLGFQPRFFFHPYYRRAMPPTFHRKRQKLSKSTWETIFARGEIYRICLSIMLDAVNLAPTRRPAEPMDVDDFGGNVEEIARAIRQLWMLPRGPIEDVTRVIESAGVVVLSYDYGTDLIDGFSQPASENLPALIFVNSRLEKDRLRFTICHELGHIVMHRMPKPEMEDEANRFAAEFLMPTDDIRSDLFETSLEQFMMLKLKWKTSMQALVRKAFTIGRLTERSYRYYMMEMSKRWGRQKEGITITDNIEKPRIWNQLVNAHIHRLGHEVPEIAEIFGLSEGEVRATFVPAAPRLRVVASQ